MCAVKLFNNNNNNNMYLKSKIQRIKIQVLWTNIYNEIHIVTHRKIAYTTFRKSQMH